MIGKEVLKTRPVSLSEVAEVLGARKEEGELGFEQQATFEYSQKFVKLAPEKARKMVEELSKIEKVSQDAAAKIADFMPKNAHELSLIFAKERYTLEESELKEVLSIVEKYR